MSRRKHQVSHENHERWLVSYADFITLLFAFFVVMFATGQTDKSKAQKFSEAAKNAFEDKHLNAATQALVGGKLKKAPDSHAPGPEKPAPSAVSLAAAGEAADLLPSLRRLNEDLKREILLGRIQVRMESRGLIISLKQAAFFPSGEDAIPSAMHASLRPVADVIKKLPNPVRFEGHTDALPIHNSRFRSNWELSAARSIAMMEIFAQSFQVPRTQMAISGYADTAPVALNASVEGRAQNRRVDILILSERGLLAEPAKMSAAPTAVAGT